MTFNNPLHCTVRVWYVFYTKGMGIPRLQLIFSLAWYPVFTKALL